MITLYTAATPNGIKVSIALEELGLDYKVKPVNLMELEQKQDWFLTMNPNGRIPVIIDHAADDFVIFESGAILVWLARKTGNLMPTDPKGESLVMQWLMFQMGGIGPMMGQSNVFTRYAPEQVPYAIDRYQREVRRLLEVLNTHLAENEYLAGDYSIADIANWSWAESHDWSGVSIDGLHHLDRWLKQIAERPAVQRGYDIPDRSWRERGNADGDKQLLKSAKNMLS